VATVGAMGSDGRVEALALAAEELAVGTGIDLPDALQLWALAGGRPARTACRPRPCTDPARALGAAMAAALTDDERRQGAHHTPPALAARVAAMALDAADPSVVVVDPACGAGALLLAAGDRLLGAGARRAEVARHQLWGADIDPLAAAVTEAAIALWSGGTAPAPGHVVVADTLALGLRAWPSGDGAVFDAVVANPPFQDQLDARTARSRATAARLRRQLGEVVSPYVDTAALFLLAGVGLVRPGGRMAVVLPESIVGARDAAAVRRALVSRATLRDLWSVPGQPFDAAVRVCVAGLDAISLDPGAAGPVQVRPDAVWADRLADARGVPAVELAGSGTVADLAIAVAGFRDEYYGLVDHVREARPGAAGAPLVTSGAIDVGRTTWGTEPIRFAKRRWDRPEVDLGSLARANPKVAAWVDRVRRPKVVVASQTHVIEAAADPGGSWVPTTPVVSVVPHDPALVHHIAAVLCSPPIAAWAARRAVGTGMSPDAVRVSAGLVGDAPLPPDGDAWDAATEALADGDLGTFAERAIAMYRLDDSTAAAVGDWWRSRLPDSTKRTWPRVEAVR
jgi:hypothetical protein